MQPWHHAVPHPGGAMAKPGWLEEGLPPLPDLPTPDYRRQQREASIGCFMVVGIIVVCVAVTRFGVNVETVPAAVARRFLAAVYTEAALALVCLCGVMLGDPGVIARSPRTCLPIPDAVREKLATGEPLDHMCNIDGPSGRSYCTRCLVWRDPLEEPPAPGGVLGSMLEYVAMNGAAVPHHCRICNRCVRRFDHHCGFLGRCIAGAGCRGNMRYFVGLITTAVLGLGTCIASVLVGVAYTWNASQVPEEESVPSTVVLVLLAVCCLQCLVIARAMLRPFVRTPVFALGLSRCFL